MKKIIILILTILFLFIAMNYWEYRALKNDAIIFAAENCKRIEYLKNLRKNNNRKSTKEEKEKIRKKWIEVKLILRKYNTPEKKMKLNKLIDELTENCKCD